MGLPVYKVVLFALLVLLYTALSFGQNTSDSRKESKLPGRKYEKSPLQQSYETELNRLKYEDRSENIPKMIEINSKLESLTGTGRTDLTEIGSRGEKGGIISLRPPFTGEGALTDDIQNTRIYTNSNRTVKGIASSIEQRGSTAGKMWSIVLYEADPVSPDTFVVYYSINGGGSWSQYVSGNIRPGDKVMPDDLDMELVENNTGQKYLWVAFGFRQANGSKSIGAFILQVPALNGAFYNMLEWPARDSTKNYYNVRLSSDNAKYAATPYVFIACSFDSLAGNGNRINSQKFARILSPYSVSNPAISYMAPSFYWYDNSSAANRITYTDAAYFSNSGTDSVILSFCGVTDSSKLYFAKCDINGNPPVTSTGAGASIGGSEPNALKQWAKLSSNGNDNGNIVCVFRQYVAGNWMVKWFSSASYGNFSAPFNESSLFGSSTNMNSRPEIVGIRNGSTHYITFVTSSAEDSIRFITMNHAAVLNSVSKMNYYSVSDIVVPKPVFRFTAGDSCICVYSEEGPVNFISASGCSGAPIGILGNQHPVGFVLNQNYPNPFNPSTTITFSIPQQGNVKLTVFDVSGKEAAVLADGVTVAGNHEVTFDAGGLASGVYFYKLEVRNERSSAAGYSEIKKMVLLK
ncbi:MAG: T9SS type A sorting domain-containing protein [Ignavibacteria bacterium]|nr:T9SS type A sorting domain-containing protein [Ignavibacteria bacterium]